MAKCPSSIFNFETLDTKSIPRSWILSVLLAMCLVLAAETAARVLLAPIGDRVWTYWAKDAADKFEWYRSQALANSVPDVLVIGDSIGVRNIDVAAFRKAAGISAFNLAWPGNFPLALKINTLPLLRDGATPEVVIVAQSPWSYIDSEGVRRNEAVTTSSILAKRANGDRLAADHVHLSRLYPARSWLFDHWIRGRPVITEPLDLGFMPHERTGGRERPEAGLMPHDPDAPPEFDAARRETLLELLELARARQFQVIVLISPLAHGQRPAAVDLHVRWLRELRNIYADVLRVWDFSAYSGLDPTDFKDALHLWADSASDYGRTLGETFASCGAADRKCAVVSEDDMTGITRRSVDGDKTAH